MPVPRDDNWRNGVERFHDLGVPIDELTKLIGIACGNKRLSNDDVWRYFCGCAWRLVTEIQEAAKALLTKEETDRGA